MLHPTTAISAVRLCLSATISAVTLLVLAVATAGRAQEHQHHPEHEDTAAMPMDHDSTAAMHDMANMPGMPGMPMLSRPFGIPMSRMGSGTAWLPDASPMRAYHWMPEGWMLMVHGDVDLYYDHQGTRRGDDQVGSTNWAMLMAMHPLGSGMLHLHGMMSAEPLTVGARGYPLLLQTGESYKGVPLRDRQHPHDLFMELSARYEVPVSRSVGVSLYAAPVGEPAIGPVAYMHRPSAQNDPFVPLGHHWQDATHITYGVLTAGVFTRTVQLEGTLFQGREPDDDRYDFDFGALDSYGGRISVNPAPHWSLAASYGYLKSPEELHPDENQHRLGASILYSPDRSAGGLGQRARLWRKQAYRAGGAVPGVRAQRAAGEQRAARRPEQHLRPRRMGAEKRRGASHSWCEPGSPLQCRGAGAGLCPGGCTIQGREPGAGRPGLDQLRAGRAQGQLRHAHACGHRALRAATADSVTAGARRRSTSIPARACTKVPCPAITSRRRRLRFPRTW